MERNFTFMSPRYPTKRLIKNENDKRFRRTRRRIHLAIDRMIARDEIKFQVRDFSDYVGIYASTFYRHYGDIPEAIALRDWAVYDDLKDCVASQNLQIVFRRLFRYLSENQLYFQNAKCRLNVEMLKDFARNELWPIVQAHWSRAGSVLSTDKKLLARIYRAYCFELLREYDEWVCLEEFDSTKVDGHVKRLLYLTDTACHRLNRY